jgi:hypothetical protein
MNSVGISLGWNCHSAVWATNAGVRQRKSEGYKTCPFDIMVSNYKGIVQCIDEDFEFFCDERFLTLVKDLDPDHPSDTELSIYHTRYNFAFNHESPGHADLYKTENWPEGTNHFVNNSFKHFKERYMNRIANFRQYLSDQNTFVTFVLTSWEKKDTSDLRAALAKRYPDLKYDITVLNDPHGKEYYLRHMKYMKCDEEVERLRVL